MTLSKVDLDVRPLSPTIGAEIHGVDCAADLDDEVVAAIRAVWLERLVVFFPDQQLDDDTQIAFAARFGDLTESHPVEPQVVERKEIHSIESGKDRTDFWHTDITFMNRPAMASMLRSIVVPEAGGDTMWADTRLRTSHWPHRCSDCATSSRPSTSSPTTRKPWPRVTATCGRARS